MTQAPLAAGVRHPSARHLPRFGGVGSRDHVARARIGACDAGRRAASLHRTGRHVRDLPPRRGAPLPAADDEKLTDLFVYLLTSEFMHALDTRPALEALGRRTLSAGKPEFYFTGK